MFKILDEVCTPKRGTKYSAYVDLFSRDDVVIGAGETKIVKLGVKIDFEKLKSIIPHKKYAISSDKTLINEAEQYYKDVLHNFLVSHYLEIALRSSLAVKGLIVANGIGIINLDYTDEIGLIVHNPIKVSKVAFLSDEALTQLCECVPFKINKGDKVAQCTLKEHKGYLVEYDIGD